MYRHKFIRKEYEITLSVTQKLWEIQKAYAIDVMTTALSVWDKGIVEAANLAEDTSFSAQVISRWAASYFLLLPECATNPADIEDINVENLLSSHRGHSTPCPNSLIDEDFKDKARTNQCQQ